MKRIISKEIIGKIKESYAACTESGELNWSEFEFSNVVYFKIGYVKLAKYGDTSMLFPDPEANKEYMQDWRKDIGGIMSKDFRQNAAQGKYFEFVDDTAKVLLRRISDAELESLTESGFNDIKIGDFWYTVCLCTKPDGSYLEPLNKHIDEIPERPEDPDDNYVYVEEPEVESISLFN